MREEEKGEGTPRPKVGDIVMIDSITYVTPHPVKNDDQMFSVSEGSYKVVYNGQ